MRTISRIWSDGVAAGRPYPAYLVEEGGSWRAVSWAEAGRRVEELAAGFLDLGIRRGERVAILAPSRLEWTLCDFALISIGAVVVPIYETSSGPECAYVLEHSGARLLVLEDEEQAAKLAPHLPGLPGLEHVLSMEPSEARLYLAALAERGRTLLEREPSAVEEARNAISEDDELTYVYTSGTTGPPKGCVLLHRNYWAMVDMVDRVEGFWYEADSTVLFLPLAHVFGRLVEFGGARRGLTIAFCPDSNRIADSLRAVRPTIFPSVPRVYEKVHAAVSASLAEAKGSRRKLADWALAVGYRASECRERRRPYPPALALQLRLADRLVFSKVKARLGGRVRVPVSGGAPLAREICAFFHALDIRVLEGYGLTESGTAATFNRPGSFRLGTVGLPFEGCEVQIAGDGEKIGRAHV